MRVEKAFVPFLLSKTNCVNFIFDGKDHIKSKSTESESSGPNTFIVHEYEILDSNELDEKLNIEKITLDSLFSDSSLSGNNLRSSVESCGTYGLTYDAYISEVNRIISSYEEENNEPNLLLYIGISTSIVVVIIIGGLFIFLKRRS